MGRYRSRSRRSYSPVVRRKRYDDPRDRHNRYLRDRRSPPPTGLLVRNISLDSRPEDIRIPFERFGPLKDVYLPKNYYTGEPRGFGFVKFRYAEDAAEAKHQLNRTVIGGREIRVDFAEENRKTPQEMRRLSRVSSRESYGRHSRSRSPRRQYSSYSRSPSPARRDSRDRRARDDYYSLRRGRSISRSVSPPSERNYRSNHMSPRPSRSISRSLSPRNERYYGSPGRSRSVSRSLSPCHETNYEPVRRSPSHNAGGPYDEEYMRSRSRSPRWNVPGHSRSRSRSYSPR